MVAFRRANGLEYPDVVRDVVRLAAIANMREQNFLNKDCVLVGGMGLRLRGSTRFTIFDTDSSIRKPPVKSRSSSSPSSRSSTTSVAADCRLDPVG